MAEKFTQQLIPFPVSRTASHSPSARYHPAEEVLDAVARLGDWLTDPRTGRPTTELAEEALLAVSKALAGGKCSYGHKAEDLLEALALRNGRIQGDDIPAAVKAVDGDDFHQTVEELLDHLHDLFAARSRAP